MTDPCPYCGTFGAPRESVADCGVWHAAGLHQWCSACLVTNCECGAFIPRATPCEEYMRLLNADEDAAVEGVPV